MRKTIPPTATWSWRFSPTGRSAITLIPFPWSWAAGPTPLNMRICGVFTLPAETITSFVALTLYIFPFFSNWTPVACFVLESISTFSTYEFIEMWRFGRLRTGRKKALDEEQRLPRRVVPCANMKPTNNDIAQFCLCHLKDFIITCLWFTIIISIVVPQFDSTLDECGP